MSHFVPESTVDGVRDHAGSVGKLRRAVMDGPEGTDAVRLPASRPEALRLKRLHQNRFWCTNQAGGCGGPLEVAAGNVRVPYFRHKPGADCVLANDPAHAERAYEHLACQRALIAWLAAQGLEASLEHHLGEDGRADVHVVVHGLRHTIEVQLSRIADSVRQKRDEKYRRQVDHVTWLYGPNAEAAAASDQAHRDYVLRGRQRGAEDAHGPDRQGDEDEGAHDGSGVAAGDAIEVGVSTDLRVAWSPLSACELRADGFWTPDLELALADLAAREVEAAERAARIAAARLQNAPVGSVQRELPPPMPSQTTLAWAAPFGTLAWWDEAYPTLAEWEPRSGWAWAGDLDTASLPVARALLFAVDHIYSTGPVGMLTLIDEHRAPPIIALLERAGVLRLYERDNRVRWERASTSN